MANRMLRLTVHDPNVIKALDALRKTRKQSAFIVEALRHFLSTPQGQEQLASYLALNSRAQRGCPGRKSARVHRKGENQPGRHL